MDRRHFLALGGMAAISASHDAGAADGAKTPAAAAPEASGELLHRKIPSTGETIPAIGLGTSGPFEVGTEPSARAPLREVLASGKTPAERLLERYHGEWAGDLTRIYQEESF